MMLQAMATLVAFATLFIQIGFCLGASQVSEEIKSMIYSTQKKYCEGHFCNVDASYVPPVCEEIQIPGSFFDPVTNQTFQTEATHVAFQKRPPCEKCSCSDDCHIFGDCCADKHIGTEVFAECDMFLNHMTGTSGVTTRYAMIVKSCRQDTPNYSPELAEKCEQGELGYIDDGRMVNTHMGNTSVTFKNKYCAECYGITDYTPWRVYIDCASEFTPGNFTDMNAFIRAVLDSRECSITTDHEDGIPSHLCTNSQSFTSSCNETGKWLEYNATVEEACATYVNPVNGYRNLFCAMCNGEDVESYLCPDGDRLLPYIPPIFSPFSAILNFDNSDVELVHGFSRNFPVTRIGEQEEHQCRDGDMYDTWTKKCREVYCPHAEQYENSTCAKSVLSEQAVITPLNLTLFYQEDILVPYAVRFPDILTTAEATIVEFLSGLGFAVKSSTGSDYAKVHDHQSLSVAVSELKFELIVMPDERLQSARNQLQNLTHFKLNVTWSDRNIQVNAVVGHDPNATESMLVSPNTFETIQEFPWARFPPDEIITVPLDFNVSCLMLRYQSSELTVLEDTVKVNRTMLGPTDYFINGDDIYICHDFETRNKRFGNMVAVTERSPNYVIEQLLTIICFSCSIFFLLLTLIVYILLKHLHTVPGLNLILLCASLLCAQSLYLFGAGAVATPVVCTVIGVFNHYCWLVAFMWMNICCFHMFRVFNNLFGSLDYAEIRNNIMIKYSAFAFCIPSAIVATTIVASYIISHHDTIGYGGPRLCFVASGLTSVISFGVPAAITVLNNTVLLIYTTMKVRKSGNNNMVKGRTGADDISRFFKLSTMTGLSWLFGFLGYFLQRVEFLYVFTVLTASQGVFIFLSFVLSRRIWRMLREQCCQKDRRAGSYIKNVTATENTTNETITHVDTSKL